MGCSLQEAWLWTLLLMCALRQVYAVPHFADDHNANLYCNKQFMHYGDSCYRYFGLGSKKAFLHAQRFCQRHQSSLVSILSSDEEAFVVQLAENNGSFWIGLNDQDGPDITHTEGVFKWPSGEKISEYVNWRPGEPINRQHLDCVKADHSGWAMASGGCASTKLPFICKRKACPKGLDIYRGSCDVILNVQSEWPLTNSLCHFIITLSLISAVLITCILSINKVLHNRINKDSLRKHLDVYPT